jgi:hypothetical protein
MKATNRVVLASVLAVVTGMSVGCGPAEEEMLPEEALGETEQSICAWRHVTAYSSNSLAQYYTDVQTTSSGCGHLWVQNYWSGCVDAFVRYYPSSGGYFDSSWMRVCNGSYTHFSNNVLAGTRFRIFASAKTEFALDL